jgi:hypothetical protein
MRDEKRREDRRREEKRKEEIWRFTLTLTDRVMSTLGVALVRGHENNWRMSTLAVALIFIVHVLSVAKSVHILLCLCRSICLSAWLYFLGYKGQLFTQSAR